MLFVLATKFNAM